jgi:hypothetical protein
LNTVTDSAADATVWSESAGMMVDLGGLLIIMLGIYLLAKGAFLFSAEKRHDKNFIEEYGSKKRTPFFFLTFGVALIVSGIIVVFVPFTS